MDKTITGVASVDGIDEPIVMRLTEAEAADDATAPVWIVEVWVRGVRGPTAKEQWIIAADFKKRGIIVPVSLEKALHIAHRRQQMRADYVYRVRNIHTKATLMAAVL